MTRRIRTGIAAGVGMLLLILDAKTALTGAQEGIALCMNAVIPSLFPFFILSNLLTGALTGGPAGFLRPVGQLCGIPAGAESLLITGLLGGYPVGAQCIRQAYDDGKLSRQDARRMLGFCSNAGPAFLFGMAAMEFPRLSMVWSLWIIHILSALLVGMILPGRSNGFLNLTSGREPTVSAAVHSSLRVMASVCGWVVLFRVIIVMMSRWCLWRLPGEGQVVVSGILELTNGCCNLEKIKNIGLRLICAAGLLGFGGLCVVMQTATVAGDLGAGTYVRGRTLHAFFSILLATAYQSFFLAADEKLALSPWIPLLILAFTVFIGLFTRKKRKNSSIPAAVGV